MAKKIFILGMVLLLGNGLLFGMCGGGGNLVLGMPRGPYVPDLPPLAAGMHHTSAPAEPLQDNTQKEQQGLQQEDYQAERPIKRRRTERPIAAGELPQEREEQELLDQSSCASSTAMSSANAQHSSQQQAEQIVDPFSHMQDLIGQINYASTDSIAPLAVQAAYQLRDIHSATLSLDQITANTLARPAYTILRLTITPSAGRFITAEQVRLIGRRFPYLVELNLAGVGLSRLTLRELSQQSFAPRIISLDLSSNLTIAADSIRDFLGAFTSLRELNLFGCLLGDQGLRALASLPCASQLTTLNIGVNVITSTGIISTISSFKLLRNLTISGNSLNNSGLQAIAEQPFASSLLELAISDMNIRGVNLEILNAFTNLRRLNISGNSLNNQQLEQLTRLSFISHLQELDISSNDVRGTRAAQYLARLTNLQSLNISYNRLGSAGLEALAERLPNLVELGISCISWTGRTPVTSEAIRRSLKKFTRLTRLRIAKNRLGDFSLKIIASLPRANQFAVLDISDNYITADGIVSNISAFGSLRELNISGNFLPGGIWLNAVAQQPFASQLTVICKRCGVMHPAWLQHSRTKIKQVLN